ncbi:hypothetical protein RhiirA4_475153 [Rhizophagus irregularis]|uniref:Uncharacterized protein n=1 Tax=Rhizophagus irregularis TaxID=588596 RepID=A0A2I1H9Q6_9GLOM|nr:hypothetical protein RhiirA4_475153 [Rhizophagus irregularis]
MSNSTALSTSKKTFQPGKTAIMEKHLISNCSKVNHSIRKAVIYMVEARKASFSKLSTSVKRGNNEVENDQATLHQQVLNRRIKC